MLERPFAEWFCRSRGQMLRLRHLTDEQLLQLADGELSTAMVAAANGHLRSCWTCRTRLEDLEQAIASVVIYRHRALAACPPPAPGARAKLIAALAAAAAEGEALRHGWFVAVRTRFVGVFALVPIGLVPLLLVAAVATVFWRATAEPVSAADIIRRADESLAALVHPGQVLHRRWNATLTVRAVGSAPVEHRREFREWVQINPNRLAVRSYLTDGRLLSASWTVADGSSRRRWMYDAGAAVLHAKPGSAPRMVVWPSDEELAREAPRHSQTSQRLLDLSLSAETITPEELLERGFRRLSDRMNAQLTVTAVSLGKHQTGKRVQFFVPTYPMFRLSGGHVEAVGAEWSASLVFDDENHLVRSCLVEIRLPSGDNVSALFTLNHWETVSASAVEDIFVFEPPAGTPTFRVGAREVLEAADTVWQGQGAATGDVLPLGFPRSTH
jgi:hypothetical protein